GTPTASTCVAWPKPARDRARSKGSTGLVMLALALRLNPLRTSTTAFQPMKALAWLASLPYASAPPMAVSLGPPKFPTDPDALIGNGWVATAVTGSLPPMVKNAPWPISALAVLSLVATAKATEAAVLAWPVRN